MSEEILGQEKRKPGRPATQKTEAKQDLPEGFDSGYSVDTEDERVVLSKSEYNELKSLLQAAKAAQAPNTTAAQTALINEQILAQFTEALKDVRKPYKSEAEIENEKRQRDQSRLQERIKKLNTEAGQAACSHMAGNYPGSRESDATAIIWHEVHSHFWVGFCTGCNRQFWPIDPDYRYWRSKRSYSTGSRSGDRMISAEEVQEWAKHEHAVPFGKASGYEITTDRPQWVKTS